MSLFCYFKYKNLPFCFIVVNWGIHSKLTSIPPMFVDIN